VTTKSRKIANSLLIALLVPIVLLAYQNCAEQTFSKIETPSVGVAMGEPPEPVTLDTPVLIEIPPGEVVCNPFGTPAEQANCSGGILGRLIYLEGAQRRTDASNSNFLADGSLLNTFVSTSQPQNRYVGEAYRNVGLIINGGTVSRGTFEGRTLRPGTVAPVNLLFSALDVRARNFSEGFSDGTDTGRLMIGNTVLNEWFALDLQTYLKLGVNEAAGFYHLIVISDDGSTVEIKNNEASEFRPLINNDGERGTTVGCPIDGEPLYLTSNTRIPTRIRYYQGPRFRIAFSVFWRRVEGPDPANNTLTMNGTDLLQCGDASGASRFTDGARPGYQNLINAGYKPLAPDNYSLRLPNSTN